MSRSHRCLAACNINFDVLCSRLGPAAAACSLGWDECVNMFPRILRHRSSLLHLEATLLAQSKVARHLGITFIIMGIIEHVNV